MRSCVCSSWTVSETGKRPKACRIDRIKRPNSISTFPVTATTLHTFLPSDPRIFLAVTGYSIPGAAITYKLFVRLTTGNESGDEAMTVTRPV
jgi:hypothetical protein